jgi:hypothetical protein
MSQPITCELIRIPTVAPISERPRVASFNFNAVFTSGIRVDQPPINTPRKKKLVLRAMLMRATDALISKTFSPKAYLIKVYGHLYSLHG